MRIAALFCSDYYVYVYFNGDTKIRYPNYGTRNLWLPDHSEVTLNTMSNYLQKKIGKRACAHFGSEAFLKVEKIEKFQVNTPQGIVCCSQHPVQRLCKKVHRFYVAMLRRASSRSTSMATTLKFLRKLCPNWKQPTACTYLSRGNSTFMGWFWRKFLFRSILGSSLKTIGKAIHHR